jgi:hypothetical protein
VSQTFNGVPFQVIDPRDGSIPNVILLNSRSGALTRELPKSVDVPCHGAAKTIHPLGGVGGWCFPSGRKGFVSMVVRPHYADGQTEEHRLRNGLHLADYVRVVDVPESQVAFKLRGRQVRYLAIKPARAAEIDHIEFVKGGDDTAPVVVAVTVEGPE